tara:strand:+ start:153 stop:2027 length:1875 start_codon:yes stop_codon:yes gene_type:complete
MAKIKTSLLKNSDSIEGIQSSINSFGASLRAANSTSSTIIRNLNDSNKLKKDAILRRRQLFGKRREAVRRREQEDLIEAGRVPGILRRTSKVIGSSTKGFLGRIMDFLGTILVGWMVTNLPVIIDAVQDLIGRIQQAAGVLKNWFEGIQNFFVGFTSNLGDIATRLMSFDFFAQKGIVDKEQGKVTNGVRRFEQDFRRMIQDFKSFNLIDYLGDGIKQLLGIKTEKKKDQPGSGSGNQGRQFDGNVPTGGTLNQEEIARAARAAGFPEDKIATMTAIAMAESSGDSAALNNNPNTGDLSYGLWQINMLGDMGPERRKLFGIESNEELLDPLTNARAAYKIYELQGYGAWSVYKSGKYRDYMVTAKKAAASALETPTPEPEITQVDQSTRYRVNDDVSNILGENAIITSTMGMQESFRNAPHKGIDIACAAGLYISLTADAVVDGSTYDKGYGYVVDLHVPSRGVHLRFAHNSKILIGKAGETVPAGTSFAITGNTGRSTGPHIHLEANSKAWTSGTPDMIPAPYVSLIRLSRAQIDGRVNDVPTINGKGGPSLNLEGRGNRTQIAQGVTPEKKGQVITIPIPTGGDSAPTPPQRSKGGADLSIPTGTTLNSFITKALLRELEYV